MPTLSRIPRTLLGRIGATVVFVALALAGAGAAHAASPAAATPRPDYREYNAFLKRYVVVVSKKDEPFDTRFDYEQLYVDENIYGHGTSERLGAIRASLLAVPSAQMSAKDRQAWALNLYDFLVLERATLKLIVPNRKYLRFKSVDEMNFGEGHFFDAPVVKLGSHDYSIAEFERRFVYGDTASEMTEGRQRAGDPRWCMALCRGMKGGPPVLPWAFSGDSLDAQLDRAARITLALPRFLRADAATKSLQISDYFAQARADLGGDLSGIKALVARLGPPAARTVAHDSKCVMAPVTMPVDRLLDQFERPKAAAPAADPKTKS
jgi:hypothetical protein